MSVKAEIPDEQSLTFHCRKGKQPILDYISWTQTPYFTRIFITFIRPVLPALLLKFFRKIRAVDTRKIFPESLQSRL